jgi:histidinol-phosphatase
VSDWLGLLRAIADAGDAIALQHFRRHDLRVETKADDSPVTIADRAIEEAARRLTRERHPDLGVYGEEEGDTSGSRPTRLIIDPIDGTRNFVRGIPVFATLLAIEQNGEVVAGLVSAPALHVRWHASRGGGVFCGEQRLQVSHVTDLAAATLFHGSIGGHSEDAPPSGFLTLARQVARTRGFGDFYQHVLVAAGAGEIAVDPRVKPWDIGPLQLMVEEAGGRATSLAGERTIYGGSLVTSNGRMHDVALASLVEDTENRGAEAQRGEDGVDLSRSPHHDS